MTNSDNRPVVILKAGPNRVEAWERLISEIYGPGERPWSGADDVLIKVNAVNFEPHVYVAPEAIGALVTFLRRSGAKRVSVMESCTNGSFTRLVFDVTGIGKAVAAAGGRSVYLDEGPVENIHLGPDLKVRVPRFIVETLIDSRSRFFYIDLAKLKTHSMTDVTLCLKNQWGFITPRDRCALHDTALHESIGLVYSRFKPDLNLVEGLVATNHGHFPLKGFEERCLWEAGVLIGGTDTVAVDAAACRFIGIDPASVEHIRHAAGGDEDLLEAPVRSPEPVEGPPEPFTADLVPFMPEGIQIHAGAEKCCREGCYSNPVCAVQVVATNYGGRGAFHLFLGKGHDIETVEECDGPALVVGPCAREEVYDRLVRRLGERNVRFSPGHNNLKMTIKHLMALMNVSVLQAAPLPIPRLLRHFVLHHLSRSQADIALF